MEPPSVNLGWWEEFPPLLYSSRTSQSSDLSSTTAVLSSLVCEPMLLESYCPWINSRDWTDATSLTSHPNRPNEGSVITYAIFRIGTPEIKKRAKRGRSGTRVSGTTEGNPPRLKTKKVSLFQGRYSDRNRVRPLP